MDLILTESTQDCLHKHLRCLMFLEPTVHSYKCAQGSACARVTAHGVSQNLLGFIFFSFFHSFCKYSPIFTLSWHLLDCRGYSTPAFIPGYLDGCLRAFRFVLTKNKASQALSQYIPSLGEIWHVTLALLLCSCDHFHSLHVQGCVLLF